VKHGISLLLGAVLGAALVCVALYYSPFAGTQSISPLAVVNHRLINLSYSPVASDTLIFTNDGESVPTPNPADVLQLWEPTIGKTRVMVVVLADSRGEPAGIGIKIWSESEATRILNSEALIDSVWHIHLPERGTFMLDQQENYWSYLRDIVVPAHRNSTDSWRGSWTGIMTIGPNALGTARVTGGNGEFANMETEGIESRSATAYSVAEGPVAEQANLTIMLPDDVATDSL